MPETIQTGTSNSRQSDGVRLDPTPGHARFVSFMLRMNERA
jgi:hypothetical protein